MKTFKEFIKTRKAKTKQVSTNRKTQPISQHLYHNSNPDFTETGTLNATDSSLPPAVTPPLMDNKVIEQLRRLFPRRIC